VCLLLLSSSTHITRYLSQARRAETMSGGIRKLQGNACKPTHCTTLPPSVLPSGASQLLSLAAPIAGTLPQARSGSLSGPRLYLEIAKSVKRAVHRHQKH